VLPHHLTHNDIRLKQENRMAYSSTRLKPVAPCAISLVANRSDAEKSQNLHMQQKKYAETPLPGLLYCIESDILLCRNGERL